MLSFTSFGNLPRKGIAGLNAISTISLLMNFHFDFYSECTSLYSHQRYRVFCSCRLAIIYYLIFLMIVILFGVKWNLSILTYFSLMARNSKHCFNVFIGYLYVLWKMSNSFAHFYIGNRAFGNEKETERWKEQEEV